MEWVEVIMDKPSTKLVFIPKAFSLYKMKPIFVCFQEVFTVCVFNRLQAWATIYSCIFLLLSKQEACNTALRLRLRGCWQTLNCSCRSLLLFTPHKWKERGASSIVHKLCIWWKVQLYKQKDNTSRYFVNSVISLAVVPPKCLWVWDGEGCLDDKVHPNDRRSTAVTLF